ncbi:hypothetical protein HYR99_30020 [Candidatus Poribacteria bacterium]|nr:hypothetical protein [Candidatus Poribacteria bacterium]
MNILDENIIIAQYQQLLAGGIRAHRMGHEIGQPGIDDKDQIIPLLHRLRRSNFFTRDLDFYDRRLCHSRYCIIHLRVEKDEVAFFIRRFLRHPDFNTYPKRLGKVVQVRSAELRYWQRNAPEEHSVNWPRSRRRR